MKITVYPNGKLVIKFKDYSYPIKYLGYKELEQIEE